MAIKDTAIRDMEKDKFIESPTRPEKAAVEVIVGNASDISGGLPFKWDSFLIDRSDSVGDVYTYSLSATPTGTVTITYTDSTKCVILGGTVVVL